MVGKRKGGDYGFVDDLIFYKERIWIPKDSVLVNKILETLHGSIIGGHTGFERTFKRIRNSFWWEGMGVKIKDYVDKCLCCQQMKVENIKKYGLLMPLPIPEAVWQDISIDFITGLPIVKGRSVMVVVVDRLSKFAATGVQGLYRLPTLQQVLPLISYTT